MSRWWAALWRNKVRIAVYVLMALAILLVMSGAVMLGLLYVGAAALIHFSLVPRRRYRQR